MGFRKVEPMLAKKEDRKFEHYSEDEYYAEIKYDGCFPYGTRIITKEGSMPIGKIVNQKKDIEILSYNEKEDRTEWKPATSFFKKEKESNWLKIKVNGTKGTGFSCTPNHEIYTSDGKKKAEDLEIGDQVEILTEKISPIQEQIFLSGILGDGSFVKDSRHDGSGVIFQYNKTEDKREMLEWLKPFLGNFNPSIRHQDKSKDDVAYTNEKVYELSTKYSHSLEKYYEMDVDEAVERLSVEGFALWIMDDGTLAHRDSTVQKPRMILHTESYSRKTVKMISEKLEGKFGYESSVLENRGYYTIHFTTESTRKICESIQHYLHPDFGYKCIRETDTVKWQKDIPNNRTVVSKSVVNKEYIEWESESHKFDLEIANNHNYFLSNGTLVSNSRLVIQKQDGEARAWTRRQKERTSEFPNLMKEVEKHFPDGTIIDGEFTFFDKNGISHFKPIHTEKRKIKDAGLSPSFVAFDLIQFDGEDMTEVEIEERKQKLEQYRGQLDYLEVAELFDSNFQQLFDRVMSEGREGLILKRKESWYYEGSRSRVWAKIKPMTEGDFVVVGYTEGEGRRSEYFGSLVLTDGENQYVGRVGGGLTDKQLEEVKEKIEDIPKEDARLLDGEVEGKTWYSCEPFVVEVQYQNKTRDGKIRSPSFNRLRDDKPIEDVQPIEDM